MTGYFRVTVNIYCQGLLREWREIHGPAVLNHQVSQVWKMCAHGEINTLHSKQI